MKKITAFFCACILLIGCTSTPKVYLAAEAEAVRNIENQWTLALQNKDTEKTISFYSSEGVVMKPNHEIYVGLQNIRNQVESDFADTTMLWNTTTATIDAVEVSSSGDIAYTRGITRSKMKTLTGIVEISDKWVSIYKKVDGQWKCFVTIWNSNDPI
jgi:ketosteroid isomerase-like protein